MSFRHQALEVKIVRIGKCINFEAPISRPSSIYFLFDISFDSKCIFWSNICSNQSTKSSADGTLNARPNVLFVLQCKKPDCFYAGLWGWLTLTKSLKNGISLFNLAFGTTY